MPWDHCGAALLDDIRTCPRCGAAKRSHTLKHGRTRRLAIGRRSGLSPDALAAAHADALPFACPGGPGCVCPDHPEEDGAADQAAALEAAHADAAAFTCPGGEGCTCPEHEAAAADGEPEPAAQAASLQTAHADAAAFACPGGAGCTCG